MKTATKWDASEYLETEEDMAAYLNQLSKETGITRDGLYKALSPTGNPSFDTVQKVVKAFGLKLDVATA